MKLKINELKSNENNPRVIKDSVIIRMMRYYELLKELKKSGNKKQKVI